LALFITWTTYGTWMPGDSRGYVSAMLGENGVYAPIRNQRGAPFASDDPRTLAAARRLQKHDTVWLNATQALAAAEAIRDAAQKRNWSIIRAAIMANHIHTLTTACPDDGPMAMRIFKGVSSTTLSDLVGHPGRWWTRGGSCRYLHSEKAITAVSKYIRNQQKILCEIANMQIKPPR
jgi:REP element-mobilizing transposase RayT